MLALMVPGLIILLVDHHNRMEEEMFMAHLKKNPNLTQRVDANGKPLGPEAQGVGLVGLFRHDHHTDHDHGSGEKHPAEPPK
ncbi:hypothetical protein BV898_12312 [Hypsibius exemplaris]|uniref:Uncharacterized protein n=1 Tax=Hypsibius exemplaris TaxID=2072580 RepID=A0A1W0WE34_HYPEX|nr:hypothetical protein BV898_12312 [Hypsibius exemplaris]